VFDPNTLLILVAFFVPEAIRITFKHSVCNTLGILKMSIARKVETVTFRIDSVLKTAFSQIAAEESKPVGELLRELVRDRVEQKARRVFEAEARRQSLEVAAAAQDPRSDEAAVLRELEAELEGFSDEWK
jgi:hypothetical protein